MTFAPKGTKQSKAQQKKTEKDAHDAQKKREDKRREKGAPNTGPIYYLSNKVVSQACQAETREIKRACKDDKEGSQAAAKRAKPTASTVGKVMNSIDEGVDKLDDSVKKAYGYRRKKNNAWIEDHCKGLWVKPMESADQFGQFNQNLQDIQRKLDGEIASVLQKAGFKVVDELKTQAVAYGEKALIREGASLASLVVPVAGEIIVAGVTVWNIVDGIWTATKTVYKAVGIAKETLEKYKDLAEQAKVIKKMLNKETTASSVLAELMEAKAKGNPCIQARRCILVPYEETEGATIKLDDQATSIGSGKAQADSGKGCCPGQTGHHVLPGAMFAAKNNPCTKNYKHSQGLVICAEGAGNQVGSHGTAHKGLNDTMKVYKKINPNTISYADASKQGIAAVRELNPKCSEKCLQAQLDAHYLDKLKCGNADLTPHSGMGGAKAPTTTTTAPPNISG